MELTLDDLRKVARMSQLELDASEENQTLSHLGNIFNLIDQMQAVDTTGVAPLMHPIAMMTEISQRLRTDAVTETNNREANMTNAPQAAEGYFLVPKVIE